VDADSTDDFLVALTAFNNGANATIAFFAASLGDTIVAEGGYTQSTQVTTSFTSQRAQWLINTDENPSATGNGPWAGAAIELVNATPGAAATARSFGMIA
jgi:hypothetical protein